MPKGEQLSDGNNLSFDLTILTDTLALSLGATYGLMFTSSFCVLIFQFWVLAKHLFYNIFLLCCPK